MTARRTALPALAAPPAARPKAAREQLDVQAYERGLVDLARVHHPTVAWWHGYRKSRDLFGSYCYLCEGFITTWDRFIPIPEQARLTIREHRDNHRAGNLPGGAAPSRGKVRQ